MAHHPNSLMAVKTFMPIFANILEFNGSNQFMLFFFGFDTTPNAMEPMCRWMH